MGQSQGHGVEGLKAVGSTGRGMRGAGVLRRQGRGGRALQPGAGRAHLSWIGVEALDEGDMAPCGWKGESREHRLAPPRIQTPRGQVWGHYSHLPSWARRSPRDFWKRVASVGLPGPPLNLSGSASWNRLLTSCGVRQALRWLTGPVHSLACAPSPLPGVPGCAGQRLKVPVF